MSERSQMRSVEVSYTKLADFHDLECSARFGELLPSESAKALEQVLPKNPGDVINRARLLGFYWFRDKVGPVALDIAQRKHRSEHILWFIENAPDCVFAGDYYLSCDPIMDKSSYESVKAAWNKRVASRPTCTQTRANFALFVFEHEKPLATRLLQEILEIDELNEWALSLLPKLGAFVEKKLPLEITATETLDSALLEGIFQSTRKSLEWYIFRHIPRTTMEIQEKVLLRDPCDIWARLDILRWCQENARRANLLTYDPTVVQRWFRHASWLLQNAPHFDGLRMDHSKKRRKSLSRGVKRESVTSPT